MSDKVVYLMSGPAHMHYLVPSLVTLRDHWRGDVTVYAFEESFEIASEIAKDKRLDIQVELVPKPFRFRRGKNEQFINKIQLLQNVKADSVLYLDADITIQGDITPLHRRAKLSGFVATQFNRWVSTGRIIRNRLERLVGAEKVNQDALRQVLENPYPSLNGGVVACVPSSPVLPLWLDWSLATQHVFICDEAVLHVLQAYVPQNQFSVVEGGRYNCSHKYAQDIENPVIYHFHGDSNVRPKKSPNAYAYWWPLYQNCIEQNYGNIQSWLAKAPNSWIDQINNGEAI